MAAQRGLSSGFFQSLRGIKLGQGFHGRVAETGESLFVEDVFQDPSVTKAEVVKEGIGLKFMSPVNRKER